GPTDYARWFNLPPSKEMRPAYEVEWSFFYEPFFILSSSAPYYYEGFKEYSYERGSFACELKARGWKFFVLNNAFVLHDGFKLTNMFEFFLNKKVRKELAKTAINHRLYRAELIAKIGSQAKKCSSLSYRTLEVLLVLAGHL
ncbi:unnamed protein product, partial [Darwinula stevensoni]